MNSNPDVSHRQWEPIAAALAESGWIVLPEALPHVLLEALRAECNDHLARGEMRQAAIGHHSERVVESAIRGDHILWFEGNTPAQLAWLEHMDSLGDHLNRTLYLGLRDYECHFASYAPGSYYRKHYDCFHNDDARVVTTVLYLHSQWQEGDGGELVLYGPTDGEQILARIQPRPGTLVVFLSAKFPHEVLATRRERASVSGWFRRSPAF